MIPQILSVALLAAGPALAEDDLHIDVGVGQSYIYATARPIARVLVSDQEVAQVQLLEQGQVQVLGNDLGSTDLWIWFRDQSSPVRTTVVVRRDLDDLDRRLRELFGGTPPVRAYTLNDRVVVDGLVSDVQRLDEVARLAAVYDEHFVNLMKVEGEQQVQLRVVFAEVNRSTLREMGLDVSWADGGLLANADVATAVSPPAVLSEAFQLIGTLSGPTDLGVTLSVLEENNLGRTLARPTLVALSGQPAHFLAGGEIPVPVRQYGDSVAVEFREFGVKVEFVPTILGAGLVDLDAYVEVSEIDHANSVTVTDVTLPALTSRKSESHLRVANGETIAMAGILDEGVQSTIAKVPLLGDLPLIGMLFRQVRHERREVEVVIFVTPEIVGSIPAGQDPEPPGSVDDLDPTDIELFLLGMDHHGKAPSALPEAGLAR